MNYARSMSQSSKTTTACLSMFKRPDWAVLDGKMYRSPLTIGDIDSIVYNAKHMPDGGETWGRSGGRPIQRPPISPR